MYRVFRFTAYPSYWPSESTVYVDSAPGTVEEYVTDKLGTPKLVGNYVGTVTYTNSTEFPTTGRLNRLYIDGSTNTLYRWDGSAYVALGGGSSGGGILYAVTSGTDTYTATVTGPTAYTEGDIYLLKFTNDNTGAATININSLGAKNLYKKVNIPLSSGDIIAGQELLVGYDGTNFQVFGVSPNQIFAYVTNAEASPITRGQVVYSFGAQGDRMTVKKASNTSESTSAKTLGLVFSSSIAANGKGFIITQGVIDGLNLGGSYAAGDTLYLGATAGTYTKIKPYGPNHMVYLGVIERANAGNGQVFVKVQNGYELDEIHDVDLVSTPTLPLSVLYYTGSLWKAASVDDVLGYTPYPSSNPFNYITASALSGYATQSWVTSQGYLTANTPITGATKTKITYDSTGRVTSGADATTADIADSTNKRYVTDSQLTSIGDIPNKAAKLQTDFISGIVEEPLDGTYVLIVQFPFAGTFVQTTTECESGSCTATWKTAGMNIAVNAVSSSSDTQVATQAFSAGDYLRLEISSNSACTMMSFVLEYTRTLA